MIAKAGLVKLNMQNTATATTFKKSVASKLASAPKATSARGFGVMAQRSMVGTGAIFNAKQYNSDSIALQRFALNNNRTNIQNNFMAGGGVQGPNNSMNKYAMAMMGLQMLSESLETIGSLKSTAPKEGGDVKSGSGANSSSPEISAMHSANDSISLRDAIGSAETKRSEMNSELNTLKQDLPNLKAAADKAKDQISNLTQDIKNQETVVKNRSDRLAGCKNNLNTANVNKDHAAQTVASYQGESTMAMNNLGKAAERVSVAELAVKADPDNIVAQKALQEAKGNYDKAKEQLKNVEIALKDAKDKYEASVEKYSEATKAYQDAQVELDNAQKELEDGEEKLNKLKKEEQSQRSIVAKYEDASTKINVLENSITTLDNEIKEQKTRLKNIETKDQNELKEVSDKMGKLAKSINTRNGKIDSDDGLTSSEKFGIKRNSKDAKKYEALAETRKQLEQKIGYSDLYSKLGETHNGKTFRAGSYNGETLYMIGSKKVDEATYTKEIADAKKADEEAKKLAEANQGTEQS